MLFTYNLNTNFVKKNLIIIGITAISFFVLAGCFPSLVNVRSGSNRYAANNPFIYKIHPEFKFYHSSDGNRLYMKINLQELMFAPLKSNRNPIAKIRIKYFLYSPDDFDIPVDSAVFDFELEKRKLQTNAVTYLNVKDVGMREYYMKVVTIDMLKRIASRDFVYVNYENENSMQNFMSYHHGNEIPYFRPYLKNDQSVDIVHNRPLDSLFVKCFYTDDIPIPTPPYSTEPYVEAKFDYDSLYSITGNRRMKFTADKKALYCLQKDTINEGAVCFINAGSNFPFVRSSEQMLYSLEYICKKQEFRDLLSSSNKKLALDRFWLKCGGNMNRARELIRIYYSRVLYANVYFTSYKQGWKTDRGMIYMMFGTPNRVKKGVNQEIWLYSDRSRQKILQFVFNKKQSLYSNNVFVLERSIDFMQFWAEAKRSWRAGKVYTVFR